MIEQFAFYFKHSLNDLRVNKQRTFFAILAVAAGVAAIVSLQTVAALIEDTLTGDLQVQNRGDLQIGVPIVLNSNASEEDVPEDLVIADETVVDQAIEDGYLTKLTEGSPFGANTDVYYTSEGVAAIQSWLDENYPDKAEVNYRVQITSSLAIFTNSGSGTVIQRIDSDGQASSLVPFVVDSDVYPFYDTIETVDGHNLADLLQDAKSVVLSRSVATELNAQTGETVRLSGAAEDFTVTGVVADEVGAAEPGIGFVSAIFGFYYIDEAALIYFDDRPVTADVVFVRLNDPSAALDIENGLASEFEFLGTITTTDDLLGQNQEFADNLDLMVTIMGLLSLLIGSIGIVNTMQVVVRRRTVEIAVLKTVGLQADQVTYLFLTEAFIMGVVGSLFGVLLGWGATFIIKEAANVFARQALEFRIVPSAVINGVVVGTLVTTVFGFLPTLSAGQVRPGIVLRPSENIVPRVGFIRNFLALIFVVIILGIIAQGILGGQLGIGFAIVGGAFVTAGVLFVVLLFVIWLVGRLLPSLGVVDLKIALRQMLVTRGRGAITLLALVVGIFALSVITMFTEALTNLLDVAINEGTRGNVVVQASAASVDNIIEELDGIQTVNSYWIDRTYDLTLVSSEKPGGEVILAEALQTRASHNLQSDTSSTTTENIGKIAQQLNTVAALTDDQIEEAILTAGRQLTPEDEGQPYLVIRNSPELEAAGIQVGDKLNFEYEGGLFNFGDNTVQLEIIGITEAPDTGGIVVNDGFGSKNFALLSAFPNNRKPNNYSVQVDIPEENITELRQAVAGIPGAIVFEFDLFVNFIKKFVDQFRAFPTLVAALGLAVGGIVIANSVALSTMERRREIAIMKSLGLQRERVLGMLLFENAILGLIGGLLGVGLGLLAIYILSRIGQFPTDTIPVGTGFLLMILCVAVALIAAVTTAWGASGEKPLNVLRYE